MQQKSSCLVRFAAAMLAALFAVIGASAYAAGTPTLTVKATFVYPPKQGTLVGPAGINNHVDIVGIADLTAGTQVGFERFPNGTYSAPIIPTDPLGVLSSIAYGINDAGEIVGGYQQATTLASYGYFLQNGTYTNFYTDQVCSGAPCNTDLLAINNKNDFAGQYQTEALDISGFVDIGGNFIPVNAGGSINSVVNALDNNSARAVGTYLTTNGNTFQSYVYVVATQQVILINYPGGTQTLMYGINNSGIITGRYLDSTGAAHGLAKVQGQWITYDYPGATFTSLERVNDEGVISGRYIDSAGANHGIILQLSVGGAS